MAKRANGEELLMLLINNFGSEMSLGEALKMYQQNEDGVNSVETAFNNKTYGNKNLQWEKIYFEAAGVFSAISPAALKVFKMLTLYANEKNGKIRIGFPRLKELTNMTKPTLMAAISECEEYALIVTQKGSGKAANTYWINPEVAQIGKSAHEDNKKKIIAFYKATGSEYIMFDGHMEFVMSEPHRLFKKTTEEFNNQFFRDKMVIKKNSNQIEDVVGIVSNTTEHEKIKDKEKSEKERKKRKVIELQEEKLEQWGCDDVLPFS